jgi:hypothetical protein
MDIATKGRVREVAREFFKESLEGMVLIVLIFTISDKPIGTPKAMFRIAKLSALIGAINATMLLFDEKSHVKIKEGMKASLGMTMLAVMGRA